MSISLTELKGGATHTHPHGKKPRKNKNYKVILKRATAVISS